MTKSSGFSQSSDLTLGDLRDTYQLVLRSTVTIWYGTSDVLERNKALMFESQGPAWPAFVVVHPDDVEKLPAGALHIRHYRATRSEIEAEFMLLADELRKQAVERYQEWIPEDDPHGVYGIMRRLSPRRR